VQIDPQLVVVGFQTQSLKASEREILCTSFYRFLLL
jgi:hypothetical protein